MKTCQQCHRALEDDQFRPTPSRGAGLRKRKTGSRNICRYCESKNTLAYRYAKRLDEGQPVDEAALRDLKHYYRLLLDAGYQLPSMGRRLLGLDDEEAADKQRSALRLDEADELYTHIAALRQRSYSNIDEADSVHRKLTSRLRDTGLYEEATNLLEEWFMED